MIIRRPEAVEEVDAMDDREVDDANDEYTEFTSDRFEPSDGLRSIVLPLPWPLAVGRCCAVVGKVVASAEGEVVCG